VTQGIAREIGPEFTGRSDLPTDTIYRTFITVRPPLNAQLLRALRAHPNVDYLSPNRTDGVLGIAGPGGAAVVGYAATASGGDHVNWGINAVRAPDVWNLGFTGGNVLTGVVDTGMDGHPNMHPDLVYPGRFYNLVQDHPDNRCSSISCWWEEPFHGTGVAGAARAVQSGVGIRGTAPSPGWSDSCHAKPFYLHTNGSNRLRVDDFADAVMMMTDLQGCGPARVAVTSVGYRWDPGDLQPLHDAFITSYYQRGVLWFAWAGNEEGGPVVFPAAFPEVVAVSALNSSLQIAFFSSQGPEVELAAPGMDLRVSWNRADGGLVDGYSRVVSGTSFAGPIAMGVARLAVQKFGWDAQTLRQKMRDHARQIGGTTHEVGYGMVDAFCLINEVAPCLGPLSVFIDGETYITSPDEYEWEAFPSGGDGQYEYQWAVRYVEHGGGWGNLGTERTQKLNVAQGDGDIELRVTVTSGGETTQSPPFRVTNSIGCFPEIIC
jgi:subtilisin